MQLDRQGDKSSEGVLKKEGNQDEKTITEIITQNQKRTGTAENTERVKQGKIERREQTTVEIISAHNKLQINGMQEGQQKMIPPIHIQYSKGRGVKY